MPDLERPNRLVLEKVEGLAVNRSGRGFIVPDNVGVVDSSGETQFLRLGAIDGPIPLRPAHAGARNARARGEGAPIGLSARAPPLAPARAFNLLQMVRSQTDTRFDPIQTPEPTIPLGPRSPQTPKHPETQRLGTMRGPQSPRSSAEESHG